MNLTTLKSIIVLNGHANSGKTAILNALCCKLSNMVNVSINQNELEPSRTNGGDQRFAVVYKARKIAICTAGDDANCVIKAFKYAEKVGAEVLVMALSIHLRGYKTAELVFDEIITYYQLSSIVDKTISTTYAPPKPKGYVDNAKVQALFTKI